ncbi:hypothetical protein HN51_041019 [Arachis hypogaea]
MANSGKAYVKCIMDIVKAYGWQRVIAIYEDDAYGGEQGMLALLFEALQKPMKIVVPDKIIFSRSVKVHKYLGYDLPYKIHAINCTYPDLVQLVYNKNQDC